MPTHFCLTKPCPICNLNAIGVYLEWKGDKPTMDKDKFRDSLDGLFAYDDGALDSGIHDENLRAQCIEELKTMTAKELSVLVRDMWLSDDILDQGYTIETAVQFVKWLEDEMGVWIR